MHRFAYHLPILRATLLKRINRFMADVRLDTGDRVTALCANTGSMKTCSEPGRPILLSFKGEGAGKYPHLWESIHMGQSWVNVNTSLPNGGVKQLVLADAIEALRGWPYLRTEVKYGRDGRSRIDLLLTCTPPPKKRKKDPDPVPRCQPDGRPDCYVEVKNTSMRAGEFSVFPDAVTERGQKHLAELTALAKKGTGAAMVYFCGRADTRAFRPADEIDPDYGKLLRKAVKAGVQVLPLQCRFDEAGWEYVKLLPMEL